jgi:Flp pilus assembly CpaE family ATPase
MFPLPVILMGVAEELALRVRQELEKVGATLEAEYRGADSALAALRTNPMQKRLFIVQFESSEDAKCILRMVETQPGCPILALVDLAGHPQNLLEANRAGATQLVPLPMQPIDLHRALHSLTLQHRAPTRDCPVFAFTGSASGCGATTLATNAAYQIAVQHKQPTILIELAQQLGILASSFDIQPACTLSDLLAEPDQIDRELVQRSLVRVAEHFDILAGSQRASSSGAFSLPGVLRVLDHAKALAQCVVLDVPCSYDEFQFKALGNASQIVLVGEQSIASIRTLKLILDTLRPGPREHTFHVVINRYDPKMDGLTVVNLQKVLGLDNIRTIPDDRAGVLAAANEGKFLHQLNPHSPVLTGINELVGTLLGDKVVPAPLREVPLLSRFFNLFRT